MSQMDPLVTEDRTEYGYIAATVKCSCGVVRTLKCLRGEGCCAPLNKCAHCGRNYDDDAVMELERIGFKQEMHCPLDRTGK